MSGQACEQLTVGAFLVVLVARPFLCNTGATR
jgi:hypothetical protein